MQKHNLIAKKIKKLILSINISIESYFNKISLFKIKLKKTNLIRNNKVFLTSSISAILILSYFLMPTTYNKVSIQKEIQNQILNKYDIKVKFNENINYGILPKPHFRTKNLSILENSKVIGNVKNFKIFISIDKLLFSEDLETLDIVLDKTDFNIQKNDLDFFYNLIKIEPTKNKIIIKRSNIFFNDKENEVLFINKIKESKFYYDSNNLENIFSSKNEIFNIPYKIVVKNDKFNKKLITEFNSKKIRLNIDNETNYGKLIKKGLLEIAFINKSKKLNYNINEKKLSFNSINSKNFYKGSIDFKPFFFQTNINYEGLSTKNLFKDDSIILDLIKTEIFNNRNLNANIKLNVKDITNINELNNLFLNLNLEEGAIDLSDTNIMWKKDLKIVLNESFISYDQNQINLIGKIILNFSDVDNFYKSFQIKKNDRKKIKQIQFDFIYNLVTEGILLDNINIDDKPHLELQEFIDKFNMNKKVFNKITFKNFVNNFFSVYSG